MIDYIKQHWVAYLVGVVMAILLGLGASYVLGIKWSTPPEIRAQRIEQEKEDGKIKDEIDFDGVPESSDDADRDDSQE